MRQRSRLERPSSHRRGATRRPDEWLALVRQRLPELGLPPEREAEVAEELAQLLADAGAADGVDLDHADEVDAFVRRQVPDWNRLGHAVGARRRPARVAPNPESSQMSLLRSLVNDLRQAWRLLAKRPGFTAVAVLATGLGIGLTSAMFSLVDYALFRPLPVAAPGELVRIYSSTPDGFLPEEPMAYPDFNDLRQSSRTLSEVTASSLTLIAIEHGGEARLEIGTLAAGNYFTTLGLKPAAGRRL